MPSDRTGCCGNHSGRHIIATEGGAVQGLLFTTASVCSIAAPSSGAVGLASLERSHRKSKPSRVFGAVHVEAHLSEFILRQPPEGVLNLFVINRFIVI